jgi:hypothetical protein
MDKEGNRIDGADGGPAEAAEGGASAGRRKTATRALWLTGGVAAVLSGLLLIPFLGVDNASAQPGRARTVEPGVVWGGKTTTQRTAPAFPGQQGGATQQVPEVGSTAPIDRTFPTTPTRGPVKANGPVGRPDAAPPAPPAPPAAPAVPVGPGIPPAAHRPSRPTTAKPPVQPRRTYTVIAGEDCTHTASQGYYRIGTYSDGSDGWYRRNGGWNLNGCKGTFMAMPMSGSKTADDPQAYAVWWFKTGAVTTGRCAVSVFVPAGSARDVAGHPAYYEVVRGEHDMRVVARFTIDQAAHRGHWVAGGSYPVSNGQLTVRLVNRGVDAHGEHLAASQVKVSCVG